MAQVHQLTSLVEGISCFAWNSDQSMIAISPNSNEIHIYVTKNADDWQRLFVLSEVRPACNIGITKVLRH